MNGQNIVIHIGTDYKRIQIGQLFLKQKWYVTGSNEEKLKQIEPVYNIFRLPKKL